MPPRRPALALIVVVAVFLAAYAHPPASHAGAEVILVTTTEDELNADGDCSLREAVVAANTNGPVDACPAGTPGVDTVHLQPVTYTLSIPGRDEDAAVTGDLDITDALTVRTAGDVTMHWATIDANGIDRVFDVMPEVAWQFHFLEITGGDAADGNGGGIRVGDGVCDAGGMATGSIHSSTIRGNVAARGGGFHIGTCRHLWLRWLSITGNRAVMEGGGVSVTGESHFGLAVSTVSSNTAAIGGGLWIDLPDGAIHLGHVTVAANAAPQAAGLWTANWATLEDTVIGDNDGPNCGGPGHAANGLSDDETCHGFGVADVGLEPLTKVGQFYVHPPGPDSIVVDFAEDPSPEWCQAESAQDQLGTLWPIDGDGDGLVECDAGAVEAPEGTAQPPARPQPTPSPASGQELPDTAYPYSGTVRSAWPATTGVLCIGAALLALVAPRLRSVRRPTIGRLGSPRTSYSISGSDGLDLRVCEARTRRLAQRTTADGRHLKHPRPSTHP